MNLALLIIILVGLTAAGISFQLLHMLQKSRSVEPFLIHSDPHRKVKGWEMMRYVLLNSGVSFVLIFSVSFGLKDLLFYVGEPVVWRVLVEFAAVVFIYDFAYYFMHRYLFHEWDVLRKVHAVHHAANYPRAVDALLIHPVETIMGLGLLFGSILIVGGIHLGTFAVLFFLYTTLNVFNHAGINVPRFPFKTLGHMAIVHDRHHHSMRSGNYASITPLPDIIFGTAE